MGKNKSKLFVCRSGIGFIRTSDHKHTDVADTAQLDLLLAELDSNVAAVNLLINSAGVFVPKTFVGKSIATNQDAESSSC